MTRGLLDEIDAAARIACDRLAALDREGQLEAFDENVVNWVRRYVALRAEFEEKLRLDRERHLDLSA